MGFWQAGWSILPIAWSLALIGILDGIAQPIGLPQIDIAAGALSFGGPSTFPSGCGDTTFVAGDTSELLLRKAFG
jgi:hypothetical protein